MLSRTDRPGPRDRGRLLGAVIVFRDISQRREADERLRQALAEVDSLRQRLELENAYLREEIREGGHHQGIIGRSPAIEATLRQIDLVAGTDATVLVTGESGTGKELIARAIHEASRRRDRAPSQGLTPLDRVRRLCRRFGKNL